MAEWKQVSKEDFDGYLEAVEIERGKVRSQVVYAGNIVFFVGLGNYTDHDWIAKLTTDENGTKHFVSKNIL